MFCLFKYAEACDTLGFGQCVYCKWKEVGEKTGVSLKDFWSNKEKRDESKD